MSKIYLLISVLILLNSCASNRQTVRSINTSEIIEAERVFEAVGKNNDEFFIKQEKKYGCTFSTSIGYPNGLYDPLQYTLCACIVEKNTFRPDSVECDKIIEELKECVFNVKGLKRVVGRIDYWAYRNGQRIVIAKHFEYRPD